MCSVFSVNNQFPKKRRVNMSDNDGFGAFLIGFVVGGVAGAVAALLLAPQSGEETRSLIKDKSIELRDKATEQANLVAKKASEQAELIAKKASEQANLVAKKAGEVSTEARTRGKDLLDSAKKAVSRKRPPAEVTE
jgi:gas vesicle protein